MKVKKFQAPTMPEAMKKVRNELGTDAVILHSKNVKSGGFLGMFKKSQTEVIAAIDQAAPVPKKQKNIDPIRQPFQKSEKQYGNKELINEIKKLKHMIQSSKNEPSRPPFLKKMHTHLLNQGMENDFADKLLRNIEEKYLDGLKTPTREQLVHWVSNELWEDMSPLSFGQYSEKKFIQLVGPTGVGKTTTVAKLAAEAALEQRKKVALITTDTYRIAAIDQLKTYGEILDIPLEVVYSPEEYVSARKKFEKYDLILIDTAGRNFRDPAYVEELKKLIDFDGDTETYLVLSLTSKFRDMKAIYQQFENIPIEKLIFTKADETDSIGSAVNMVVEQQLGIAYVTTGQNVPDDINEASSVKLIDLVMEGYDHE